VVACGDWVAHANPSMYLERAVTTAVVAANLVLADAGRALWPVLGHPAPEWFAGRVAGGLTYFRQAMLRRRQARKRAAGQ
jgi:hypothetical protein